MGTWLCAYYSGYVLWKGEVTSKKIIRVSIRQLIEWPNTNHLNYFICWNTLTTKGCRLLHTSYGSCQCHQHNNPLLEGWWITCPRPYHTDSESAARDTRPAATPARRRRHERSQAGVRVLISGEDRYRYSGRGQTGARHTGVVWQVTGGVTMTQLTVTDLALRRADLCGSRVTCSWREGSDISSSPHSLRNLESDPASYSFVFNMK